VKAWVFKRAFSFEFKSPFIKVAMTAISSLLFFMAININEVSRFILKKG
jgi:hypothetical protein